MSAWCRRKLIYLPIAGLSTPLWSSTYRRNLARRGTPLGRAAASREVVLGVQRQPMRQPTRLAVRLWGQWVEALAVRKVRREVVVVRAEVAVPEQAADGVVQEGKAVVRVVADGVVPEGRAVVRVVADAAVPEGQAAVRVVADVGEPEGQVALDAVAQEEDLALHQEAEDAVEQGEDLAVQQELVDAVALEVEGLVLAGPMAPVAVDGSNAVIAIGCLLPASYFFVELSRPE